MLVERVVVVVMEDQDVVEVVEALVLLVVQDREVMEDRV
jgi:hypothetical protein